MRPSAEDKVGKRIQTHDGVEDGEEVRGRALSVAYIGERMASAPLHYLELVQKSQVCRR